MKQRFGIVPVFATTACGLVLSLAFAYWVGEKVLGENGKLLKERTTIDQLDEFLSAVKDAESGQRGYLLTGDEHYLEPYHRAVLEIQGRLNTLAGYSVNGRLPAADVAAVQALTDKKLVELAQTIALRRRGDFDAAAAIVRSDQGKNIMDQIRSQVADLRHGKEAELNHALQRSDHLTMLRTSVWALTVVFNLGFLAWAYQRIRREIKMRDAATTEAVRQKDLTTVTLASIGDAVIVTNRAGKVTFLNGVAEQVTGWTAAAALGQPLPSVFNIINEETRETVESPVDKVLRLGTVAGLANHTVLIAKDGREVPIDDSGAPIRSTDGAIRGVVLVFRDISERKHDQAELSHAKDVAERASRTKSDFLANMSHEIRTPLTAIMGFTDLLLDPDTSREDKLHAGGTIRRNGKLLTQLIDDILDLSKVEAGKLLVERLPCSLSAIVADVASTIGAQAREKGIDLRITPASDVPEKIHTDPVRLKQILFNIVGNAVKFTSMGSVDVAIRGVPGSGPGGHVEFTVTDTGKGIAPEDQPQLFQAFSQGDSSTTRRYGGTGLGLTLSRRLAEALGGTIRLTRSAPGVGSTFTVVIESTVMGGQYRPRDRTPIEGGNDLAWTAGNLAVLKGIRVLVVEDAPDNQVLISQVLRRHGAEIMLAENGKEAVERALGDGCDVVLMDLQMPVCDGYRATQELRRKGFEKPILALSAAAMPDDQERAVRAGCNDHLTKPIKWVTLVKKILEYVTASRTVKA